MSTMVKAGMCHVNFFHPLPFEVLKTHLVWKLKSE